MGQITRVFIDTSKQFYQLHGVDEAEQPALRRKLQRHQMISFFSKLEPTVVGLEACGASHHWARELAKLGHQVKLVAPQHVKPYRPRGKNDAADAEAGCECMSRPRTRFVPVKTAEQLSDLMLLAVRERMIKTRTQLGNEIRGHAAEFGLVADRGLAELEPLLARIAADETVPLLAKELFAVLGAELARLQEALKPVEKALMAWHRANPLSRNLVEVPSIGPVGAALLVMKTPDPRAFSSGRNYSAWMGNTPKDHSTAGKERLGEITKAGDEALRATLVCGATAVIKQVRLGKGPRWPWLVRLVQKKDPKPAAVALANKVARIAWKMMVTGERFDADRMMRELPPDHGTAATRARYGATKKRASRAPQLLLQPQA